MPIAVHVPILGEDHTWSLTPIGVRVPTLGEDRASSPQGPHMVTHAH